VIIGVPGVPQSAPELKARQPLFRTFSNLHTCWHIINISSTDSSLTLPIRQQQQQQQQQGSLRGSRQQTSDSSCSTAAIKHMRGDCVTLLPVIQSSSWGHHHGTGNPGQAVNRTSSGWNTRLRYSRLSTGHVCLCNERNIGTFDDKNI